MVECIGHVRGSAGVKMVRFASEAQLVRSGRRLVRAALRDARGLIRTRYEVAAPGGVPDLVVFACRRRQLHYVITMEFKLRNWRRALRQAFRHRNYVNEAYVVLDAAHATAAIEHVELFERANVGLVTVDRTERVRVWHSPEPALPFSPAYARFVADKLVAKKKKKTTKDLPFIRSVRGGSTLVALRGIGESTWRGESCPLQEERCG